ncbi:uncharacterized protein [Narcine bancroftii]|uniref:uncharacterized protein n=1 Tax=Narcine bancroftii TaxID=1343680 RepID=UPI0038318BAD
MSARGIHQGYLKKYGGFVFKQWKEKFFFLTLRGSLGICRDHASLPETEIPLATSCRAILRGGQISDLPRLPLGAERDCCLALVLSKGKLLLLLAANREDSSRWLKVLEKVKETFPPTVSTCLIHVDKHRRLSFREECMAGEKMCQQHEAKPIRSKAHRSAACLRHGAQSHRVVRAACLLVGGAAVSPTLGYTMTSSAAQPPDTALPDLKELGIHSTDGCQELDCGGCNLFECETMDQNFDTFDFGGFAF